MKLSISLVFAAFLAIPTVIATPAGFTMILSKDGFDAQAANLAKRGDPGQCEQTCPDGSPRVASCGPVFSSSGYEYRTHCYCAGNGLLCVGSKNTHSLSLRPPV